MAPSPFIIIAIDGGAASGKSSSSKILADRFNLLHVDTGSFYRHLTYELVRRGVAPTDLPALTRTLAGLDCTTRLNGRSAQLLIDGQPAGQEIRGQNVNEQVSHYAAIPEVRHKLLGYQRGQTEVARQHGFRGLVMEGRDIGSIVFPDSPHKFYIDASEAVRAARRKDQGLNDAVGLRDKLDSTRKTAPLIVPEGALRIDSSEMTLEQVVAAVLEKLH